MDENIPLSLAIFKISRTVKRYLDCKKRENSSDCSTQNHSRIIGFIYNNRDRDIFQRDIEKEFDIRRSTATNTLKLMEKNGLIKREKVSYDERLKKITLTESATKTVHAIDRDLNIINKTLEKGITEEERKIFFKVLEKISKNIEEASSYD